MYESKFTKIYGQKLYIWFSLFNEFELEDLKNQAATAKSFFRKTELKVENIPDIMNS